MPVKISQNIFLYKYLKYFLKNLLNIFSQFELAEAGRESNFFRAVGRASVHVGAGALVDPTGGKEQSALVLAPLPCFVHYAAFDLVHFDEE